MKEEFPKESFIARLEDMCRLTARRRQPVFSSFLNDREQFEAESFLSSRRDVTAEFWGGNEACTRKILRVCGEDCFAPDDHSDFPVFSLTLTYRKADKPGHRDFLGSFMALGIKRETLGDIFVGEGVTAVYCTKTARDMITDGVLTVGRVGVSVEDGITDEALAFIRPPDFEEITVIIASERVDCIVSGITGISREKSASLIRSGGLMLNYSECGNVSRMVSVGDVITLRGYGKFIVCGDAETTKKGRIKIELKKYK